MGRRRRPGHEGEQDFELNLASIIDCFTVLITYMLVAASFISLGALEVSVPMASAEDREPASEQSLLDVRISEGREISLTLEGPGGKSPVPGVAPKEGRVDAESLAQALETLKERGLDGAVVSAGSNVEYEDVVRVVEAVKKLTPNLAMGSRVSDGPEAPGGNAE